MHQFTEVTRSHEAIAAHWNAAAGYPPAGTIFFQGDVLFSRPVLSIDMNDIQITAGHILQVKKIFSTRYLIPRLELHHKSIND